MRRQSVLVSTLVAAVAGLGLVLSGCGEAGPGDGEVLTKEQARAQGGGKADGRDFCEEFGWYGDGVCDDFCPQHDSDCGPRCSLDNNLVCALYCPYGYQEDENGCLLCACKESPIPECPPVLCELYCENGFDTDENGCEVCRCKQAPEPPQCPAVFTCAIYCEFGLKTDENGCEICACNEPPTDDRTVAEGWCVKNSNDECSSDADCVAGGCGGELCYNPASGGGISTCECTQPTGVSCGCVNGRCAWYN